MALGGDGVRGGSAVWEEVGVGHEGAGAPGWGTHMWGAVGLQGLGKEREWERESVCERERGRWRARERAREGEKWGETTREWCGSRGSQMKREIEGDRVGACAK